MSVHPGPGTVSVWPGWQAEEDCVLPTPQLLVSAAFPCPALLRPATHTPAALGAATWPWHGDWFDRFHRTHKQPGAGAGQA